MHKPRARELIEADRQRYEEHQSLGMEFSPKALPEPSGRPAPELSREDIRYQDTIPGGWYTTIEVKQGETLRLATNGASSSAAIAAWNTKDPNERMNLADTVKLQWTTHLCKGRVIFSDMGRVVFSIVEDSCGAHDILAGGSTPATVAEYNDPSLRNTVENMVLAVAKIGLDHRDLPALLNLFSPVRVGDDGNLVWRDELIGENDWVDLRAEMDLLVAVSNCPHPLAPNAGETPPALSLYVQRSAPISDEDLCRTATAEAQRGFENNARIQGDES